MESDDKQSRLGIASVCVFLAGGSLASALIVPGLVRLSGTWMGGSGEDLILAGVAVGLSFAVASLDLGIAGLRQKGRRKGSAVLGAIPGGVIVFAAVALVLRTLVWAL
jgi:hypothetical protein